MPYQFPENYETLATAVKTAIFNEAQKHSSGYTVAEKSDPAEFEEKDLTALKNEVRASPILPSIFDSTALRRGQIQALTNTLTYLKDATLTEPHKTYILAGMVRHITLIIEKEYYRDPKGKSALYTELSNVLTSTDSSPAATKSALKDEAVSLHEMYSVFEPFLVSNKKLFEDRLCKPLTRDEYNYFKDSILKESQKARLKVDDQTTAARRVALMHSEEEAKAAAAAKAAAEKAAVEKAAASSTSSGFLSSFWRSTPSTVPVPSPAVPPITNADISAPAKQAAPDAVNQDAVAPAKVAPIAATTPAATNPEANSAPVVSYRDAVIGSTAPTTTTTAASSTTTSSAVNRNRMHRPKAERTETASQNSASSAPAKTA